MTDKVQKIRKEVERLMKELIQEKEKGFGSDVDDACILELQNVLTFIDSLQEEPVSEELEEAAKNHAVERYRATRDMVLAEKCKWSFKEGAMWNKRQLWKDAQGDDLPEIDREVIVICKNGRVAFGHRPVEKFIVRPIGYGRTEEVEVKTFDKGCWNIPNAKWWLDVELPKE